MAFICLAGASPLAKALLASSWLWRANRGSTRSKWQCLRCSIPPLETAREPLFEANLSLGRPLIACEACHVSTNFLVASASRGLKRSVYRLLRDRAERATRVGIKLRLKGKAQSKRRRAMCRAA